ncbi:MAG: chromate transporter [Sphaerochaetaceae bacterium]
MNERKTSLASLFWTFAKIGVMTFGGGYAMLPMLQREVVEKRSWCTDSDILDYFAVGQCTPGIIAVNTATFIGYKRRGNWGGIFATLGMVFPSFVIISILASVLAAFEDNRYVQMAFSGVRVAVCALITVSVIKLAKKSIIDIPTFVLCLLTFTLMLCFSLSPVVFVFGGIVWGLVFSWIRERAGRKK